MKQRTTITRLSLFSLSLGLFFATSCKKDAATGNATIQFAAQANNNTYTMTGSTITPVSSSSNTTGVATVNWTAGYVIASEFEFEAEKENNNNQSDTSHVQYEVKGPFRIDLFAAPAPLASLNLQAATYDRVQVEILGVKSTTGDPNFYLKGTYTNAMGVVTPVVIQLNENFDIESDLSKWSAQAITYTSLVKIHLDLLLQNISTTLLDSASQTNGSIVISSTSNASIYQVIVANLRHMSDVEFH